MEENRKTRRVSTSGLQNLKAPPRPCGTGELVMRSGHFKKRSDPARDSSEAAAGIKVLHKTDAETVFQVDGHPADRQFVVSNDILHRRFQGDLGNAPLYFLDAMTRCKHGATLNLVEHEGIRYHTGNDAVIIEAVDKQVRFIATTEGQINLAVGVWQRRVVQPDGVLPMSFQGPEEEHVVHIESTMELPYGYKKQLHAAYKGKYAFGHSPQEAKVYPSQVWASANQTHRQKAMFIALGASQERGIFTVGTGFIATADDGGSVKGVAIDLDSARGITRWHVLMTEGDLEGLPVRASERSWVLQTDIIRTGAIAAEQIRSIFHVVPLGLMGPAEKVGKGNMLLIGDVQTRGRVTQVNPVKTASCKDLIAESAFIEDKRVGMTGIKVAHALLLQRIFQDLAEQVGKRDALSDAQVDVTNTCRDMQGIGPAALMHLLGDLALSDGAEVSYQKNELHIEFDSWNRLTSLFKIRLNKDGSSITISCKSTECDVNFGPPRFKMQMYPRPAAGFTVKFARKLPPGGGLEWTSNENADKSKRDFSASLAVGGMVQNFPRICRGCLQGPACQTHKRQCPGLL